MHACRRGFEVWGRQDRPGIDNSDMSMIPPTGLTTPVLLLIHARPDSTKLVFESIRSVRPRQLFVAADGSRTAVEGEDRKCAEARQMATRVDWDCNLQTLFRSTHLGLEPAVRSAIDWFFEQVEEGIILEDDCRPSASFYPYCEDLLDRYRREAQIMHIGGDNFQYGRKRGKASYYFSKYALTWGWATWRRAWRRHRADAGLVTEPAHTWDAQWQQSLDLHAGLAIVPNVNLVTNVGFGPDASHTRTRERYSYLPAGEIEFPLVHPQQLIVDREADVFTYYSHFRNVPRLELIWLYRLWDGLYSVLKRAKRGILGQEQR